MLYIGGGGGGAANSSESRKSRDACAPFKILVNL